LVVTVEVAEVEALVVAEDVGVVSVCGVEDAVDVMLLETDDVTVDEAVVVTVDEAVVVTVDATELVPVLVAVEDCEVVSVLESVVVAVELTEVVALALSVVVAEEVAVVVTVVYRQFENAPATWATNASFIDSATALHVARSLVNRNRARL
jgi:hypothetical protein